jgi:hypothetical protein
MTNIEKITEILNKYTEPQDGDYYLHGCIMNGQLEDLAEEIVKKFDLSDVVSSSCDCKQHSIKTSYGFEVCTKCGNEWDK